MANLYENFKRHFDVVSADTVGLIETAYRLRYQVYCQENSYEDAALFPDQLEIDEYDLHSPQSMVKCRMTGKYTGLVRLVLADPVDTGRPFPVEKYCNLDLPATNDLSGIDRESLAEISRFSISKAMKSKCLDRPFMRVVGGNDIDYDRVACYQNRTVTQKLLPLMTIGLFAGIVRMSAQNNITHWLAVMEPTLLRFLTRFGIYFQPVGQLVDYHGKRQPAIGVIDEVLGGIYAKRPDVWAVITDNGNVWPLGDSVRRHINDRSKGLDWFSRPSRMQ